MSVTHREFGLQFNIAVTAADGVPNEGWKMAACLVLCMISLLLVVVDLAPPHQISNSTYFYSTYVRILPICKIAIKDILYQIAVYNQKISTNGCGSKWPFSVWYLLLVGCWTTPNINSCKQIISHLSRQRCRTAEQ
jgi:hypothetical protein